MENDDRPVDLALEAAARAVLAEAAGSGSTITYGALADVLTARGHQIDASDPGFGPMLGRISTSEDVAGRGLLSAVVVRRDGGRPSGGFFRLAERLGRDTSDREACWRAELARVVAAHRGPDAAGRGSGVG